MMVTDCYNQVGETLVKLPTLATAGDYVMVMTATGMTVQDSREKVYRRLERLGKQMPGSPLYRTDNGLRLLKQIPELNRTGYVRGFNFSDPQGSANVYIIS